MQKIIDFIFDNWESGIGIAALLYELIVRYTPTEKNRSLIDFLFKIFSVVVKNNRVPQADDKLSNLGDKNRVWIDRSKHIVKVIVFLLISSSAMAQQVGTFRTLRLVNLLDSTQVLPINGSIYYNEQSDKFRVYQNNQWYDMLGSGGGTGNVTGTFVAPRVPYATGASSLSSKAGFQFIQSADELQAINLRTTSSVFNSDSVYYFVGNLYAIMYGDSIAFRANDTGKSSVVKIQPDSITVNVADQVAGTSVGMVVKNGSQQMSALNGPNAAYVKVHPDSIVIRRGASRVLVRQDTVTIQTSIPGTGSSVVFESVSSDGNENVARMRAQDNDSNVYSEFGIAALAGSTTTGITSGNVTTGDISIVGTVPGSASIRSINGSTSVSFDAGVSSLNVITQNNASFPGIRYDQDYTANMTTRSIPDVGYIAARYLPTSLNSAQVLLGNSSNIATARSLSGAITINNTGVTSYSTSLPVTLGGTGQTSWTTGDLLYASGTNTLSKIAVGANGLCFRTAAGLPGWGILPTTGGGTGLNTIGSALQVLRVNAGGTALEYATVGGGVSNSATLDEVPITNASGNLVSSGVFGATSPLGNIYLGGTGTSAASGFREIIMRGSPTNVGLTVTAKGAGNYSFSTNGGTYSFGSTSFSAGSTSAVAFSMGGALIRFYTRTSGNQSIEGGQSNTSGQTFTVKGLDAVGNTARGTDMIVTGGDSDFSVNAGHVTIRGGNASVATYVGGNLNLSAGTGPGGNGNIIITNLPTSSAGLPTGALWNNAGVLSIAP